MGHGLPLVVVGSVTLLLTCTAFQLLCMGILAEVALQAEDTAHGPYMFPQAQELGGS
jgi:hypothetical protein